MKTVRLGLLTLLLAAPTALAQPDGVNFRADFRGKTFDPKYFNVTGPNARDHIRGEPEGLRIGLPTEGDKQWPVGIVTRFPVKGDFDIVTSYEILRADRPTDKGYGSGASLYLVCDPPVREAISFGRFNRKEERQVYALSRNFTDEKGKRQYRNWYIPSDATKGKLRLVRKGKEIAYLAAEGDGDDFKELKKIEWVDSDVKEVRIAADNGNSPIVADVRFADLAITSGNAPKDVPAPPQVADPGPPPPSSRRWVLWLIAGLVIVGLLSSGGVWLWLQTRSKPEPAPTPAKRRPPAKA